MKIALLNLPLDNNYGGNLQRFAIMRTFQKMGYDITFLYCVPPAVTFPYIKAPLVYLKRFILRYILMNKKIHIRQESYQLKENEKVLKDEVRFMKSHYKVSQIIYSKKDLIALANNEVFDCYIVGSDQVWRKSIAHEYAISTYFLDFLPNNFKGKRIALAASFGTDINELNESDITKLGTLYQKFDAISFRENSGLNLIKSYKWNGVKPISLIDPTFLINKSEYLNEIEKVKTVSLNGDIFCYILDYNFEKENIIRTLSNKLKMKSYICNLQNSNNVSIEQWLRFFYEAKFIVTDSFHGVVFSIIFNKPFKLLINRKRGKARFDSLFEKLGINDTEDIDWNKVNQNILYQADNFYSFIKNNIQ